MSRPLTANEATLLAAGISALVSIIVTLLMLRFGPNYKQQISDLNIEIRGLAGTPASLLERQSSATDLLERRLTEETSVQWQPSARTEATKDETFLTLKSDREFRLHRIMLLGPAGAVVHELQKAPDWDQLQSRGYRISIPNKALVEMWNNSQGPRVGWATGAIGYEVSAADQRRSFSLPVMLKQDFYTEGGTAHSWVRVTG